MKQKIEENKMDKLVDDIILRVENLKVQLKEDELSALSAGLKDILESRDKLVKSLSRIKVSNDNNEFQDAMIELQMELVNHIKPHILSMEEPLMKIINAMG